MKTNKKKYVRRLSHLPEITQQVNEDIWDFNPDPLPTYVTTLYTAFKLNEEVIG